LDELRERGHNVTGGCGTYIATKCLPPL
jgi:hypothetical protein